MKCRKEIKGNTVHLLFPGLVSLTLHHPPPALIHLGPTVPSVPSVGG